MRRGLGSGINEKNTCWFNELSIVGPRGRAGSRKSRYRHFAEQDAGRRRLMSAAGTGSAARPFTSGKPSTAAWCVGGKATESARGGERQAQEGSPAGLVSPGPGPRLGWWVARGFERGFIKSRQRASCRNRCGSGVSCIDDGGGIPPRPVSPGLYHQRAKLLVLPKRNDFNEGHFPRAL